MVTIFTKEVSRQLLLDLAKYNSQYPAISIKEFNKSHDRFFIIDDKKVYHFGASLKDLGKKWFAFSRFDKEAFKMMERLGYLIISAIEPNHPQWIFDYPQRNPTKLKAVQGYPLMKENPQQPGLIIYEIVYNNT